MHTKLLQTQKKSLLDDATTCRKLEINMRRNLEQDHTALIDEAAQNFNYAACKDDYWNPEQFSLLYGTPLLDEATTQQRIILNQLYWVAYYSQIISAEIATIFLNQISAAGLYALEDFRIVADSLDLESRQERAHINAFKKISEEVESELFGKRLFTYPMRGLFTETMVFANTNAAKRFWRKLQLHAFSVLSSTNAFLASQYLVVRGLRTLNGKLIQHQLSHYYTKHPTPETAPLPSAISYYHFMDESYHFNTSKIIGHDIPRSLEPPTRFEKFVMNRGISGCQKDHYHFSIVINGIFWYDPALYQTIFELLRSPVFNMNCTDALEMLRRCFTLENQAFHNSHQMHQTALRSYRAYVEPLNYLSPHNLEMQWMAKNSLEKALQHNKKAFEKFNPA